MATPNTDLKTAYETKTCNRCGGCGKYSYNQIHGSTCYGCGGSGVVYTVRGEATKNFFRESIKVKAGDVQVGWFARGQYSGKWFPVTSVETKRKLGLVDGKVVETEQLELYVTYGKTTHVMTHESMMEAQPTMDAARELKAAALVHQQTLNERGKVASTKVTATSINRELKKRGIEERIVQGKGYCYFIEGRAHEWFSSSIPVCYTRDLTIERVLEIHAQFVEENAEAVAAAAEPADHSHLVLDMRTTKRTDVHAPSVIMPEDYVFVAFEHIKIEGFGDCAVVIANRASIKAHMEITGGKYSTHAHGGNCMVCGNANAVYTVLFYHAKTNTYVRMGDTCAQKVEMSYGDINYFMQECRLAESIARGQRAAAINWEGAGLQRAYDIAIEARKAQQYESKRWEVGNRIADMLATTERYGTLTQKMVDTIKRLAESHDRFDATQKEREQERAQASDAPTGRVRVEGTVLNVKVQETVWGTVTKMTVKAKEGFVVWATVPSGMHVTREQAVAFMATLEPSKDDKKFAFGKRPTVCK